MKVVILAGGLGTRISEETENKPKPMVLINENPILWHLMKIFSKQGYKDFILALGYKQEVARNWAQTFNNDENWTIDAFDTGLETQTGGRIKRCMQKYPGQRLLVTYGDGLANVSIQKLLDFHLSHGKLATVTAVRPPARFGYLHIEEKKNFLFTGTKDRAWSLDAVIGSLFNIIMCFNIWQCKLEKKIPSFSTIEESALTIFDGSLNLSLYLSEIAITSKSPLCRLWRHRSGRG